MVIGIAGGVGSGKSTVLKLLEKRYHACICMADELGHRAMEQGSECYQEIVRMFGPGILTEEGKIDRNILAEIVYRNPKRLADLNGVIHPAVKRKIRRQIAESPPGQIFVLETAILYETGCDELCDEVWGIITEDEIRIRRLMESRGYTRERAESIMASQIDNTELGTKCDFVLMNNGGIAELENRILAHMEKRVAKCE